MNNSILNTLLIEYSNTRKANIKALNDKKRVLYKSSPRLKEIEEELTSLSISTVKSILSNNNSKHIKILKEKQQKLNNERIKILKSLNLTEDYLKINYTCPKCKDTGYIIKSGSSKRCSCLEQKLFDISYNNTNVGNLEIETFENFKTSYYSNKIDEEKYGFNISPRDNIKEIKQAALSFVNTFDDKLTAKNLLFTGPTGLGKTFMANAIINEMLKKGKTVLYQSAPIMFDKILDTMFNKNPEYSNLLNNLLNVDLLVIDDLGTESMNSLKLSELYKIINSRLLNANKSVKTIISTNLNLVELHQVYDERIVSRFLGYYDILYFFGEDIRINKNK